MDVLLLVVGAAPATREPDLHGALTAAGARVRSHAVAGVGPDELDEILDRVDGRRLIIASSPADLAAVLRRLMRRGELDHVDTGVLIDVPVPFLARHGIPSDVPGAARVAVNGACRTVGVLKDDSGHLVLDHAEVRAWQGSRFWMRAYVEDERLCDGPVTGLRVTRGPAGGLRATVSARSRFGRRLSRSIDGRAMQLACDDAAMTSDGAGPENPRRRRLWWDEPEQWRLACGESPDGRN